jgi:hypothetical protein
MDSIIAWCVVAAISFIVVTIAFVMRAFLGMQNYKFFISVNLFFKFLVLIIPIIITLSIYKPFQRIFTWFKGTQKLFYDGEDLYYLNHSQKRSIHRVSYVRIVRVE